MGSPRVSEFLLSEGEKIDREGDAYLWKYRGRQFPASQGRACPARVVGVGGQSLGKLPCFAEQRERIWNSQGPSWSEGLRTNRKKREGGEMSQLVAWGGYSGGEQASEKVPGGWGWGPGLFLMFIRKICIYMM